MTEVDAQRQPNKKRRFWQVHIKAWGKSGLSQRQYCDRTEISSSQLSYWKKKLKQEGSSSVSFVPVSVPVCRPRDGEGMECKSSGLTILLKKDIRIEISNEFEEATLLKLLIMLGGQ